MEQTVNIKLILDKLTRHPLLQDVSLEQVVDYTVDFLRIVGVPTMYEEKVAELTIVDYRAVLPLDFHTITQIKLVDGVCFRHSSDSFHLAKDTIKSIDLTYKIQGNLIYTSIEKGDILIAYNAIAVDTNGYPLLPDNSNFTRALELYIKKQIFTIFFDLGKISGAILQNVQQEYAWAVGACETEFNRLTIDQAESLFNSFTRLLSRPREHLTGFKNIGVREQLNIK